MTDAITRRPVPHIQHTPELEAAALAVLHAKDGAGKPVNLCMNPLDPVKAREALAGVAAWFDDPNFFFSDDSPGAELAAAHNLALLATLHAAHLKAGNTLETPS